jgi:four helix bundle protein
MDQKTGRFDLQERTAKFGEDVIELCRKVKLDTISQPVVSQLVRSATSVGANYAEANNASSRKDFRNKIFICKKEAEETKYWLRILVKAAPGVQGINTVTTECQELIMILQKIVSSLDK